MPRTVLKLENVKKTIGRKTIVSGLSLEVQEGEIFGFLGPNGAGKTTTIKMIVGLSSITEGRIFVGGHSVKEDFRAAMRNVGCIVENPDLYRYMSGLDNLRLFARLNGGVADERIRQIVRTVGLEGAIRNHVKTYSLGMKQRLGIAQALLHEPELLVLDEPTNGLDPAGIHDMRVLLRGLAAQKGLTVFVSSHILSEMQQMCDRVGIIQRGSLVTVQTVQELTKMSGRTGAPALTLDTDDPARAAGLLTELGFPARAEADGVHLEAAREKVPALVRALTEAGIGLYALERGSAHSLEDVFMKLTGEDHR